MKAPSTTVKGHRMIVQRTDVYLAVHQMSCSCGYLGMVRKNYAAAAGDIERHDPERSA